MAILYVSQNYHPTHPFKYYLCLQKMSIKKCGEKSAVKDRRKKVVRVMNLYRFFNWAKLAKFQRVGVSRKLLGKGKMKKVTIRGRKLGETQGCL